MRAQWEGFAQRGKTLCAILFTQAGALYAPQ